VLVCSEGCDPSMGVSSDEVINLDPEGVDTEPGVAADDETRLYASCLLTVCAACSSRAFSAADVLAIFVSEEVLKPGATPACLDLVVERDEGLSQYVAGNVPCPSKVDDSDSGSGETRGGMMKF
jgi:hypothetical protein